MKKLLTFLIFLISSSNSFAINYDGASTLNTLNTFLNGWDSRDKMAVSMDIGYIAGFIDAMHLASFYKKVDYDPKKMSTINTGDIIFILKQMREIGGITIGESPLPYTISKVLETKGVIILH
jgi:hypothetical protein